MLAGHKKQWEFLKNKFEAGQLSHAYLFTGPKEIGKGAFAKEFAELVGCRFPDLKIVEPSEKDEKFGDGGEIKISQIKEINNFLSYKSYHGGYRAVIIQDAEKMNTEAQNCFLKTLEEPKGNTLIVLVSSMPDALLPTIFSRCQTVKFSRPKNMARNPEKEKKEKEIFDSLIAVINSNLADRFKYAKSIDFQEEKLEDIICVIQKHFRDLLLSKTVAGRANKLPVSEKYSVSKIIDIINLSEDISNKLIFTNINPKLALETLLIEI